MTIAQAVTAISDAIDSYTACDENGIALIPAAARRPILLYGPPGLGKTAIVRQAADHAGIAFLSYAMTHHTRQSALGLPQIVQRTFAGKEYDVTEYTMSDIMRDVYEMADTPNGKHGILFLDEIACVSETLMPAILELLQFKRFGRHTLPEGWCIICAANPEEYNRSAHSFDPVTLDRVRMIRVEPDFGAWFSYAASHGCDPVILSYLQIRQDELCVFGDEGAVTPRSWSDLSIALTAARRLGKAPDRILFEQFLQVPYICDSFALYFAMCEKAAGPFDMNAVFAGDTSAGRQIISASYDEKLFFTALLACTLTRICGEYEAKADLSCRIENLLAGLSTVPDGSFKDVCSARLASMEKALTIRRDAGILNAHDEQVESAFFRAVRTALCSNSPKSALSTACTNALKDPIEAEQLLRRQLVNGMHFAFSAFGDTSLKIVFHSALRSDPHAYSMLRRYAPEETDTLKKETDINTSVHGLKDMLKR